MPNHTDIPVILPIKGFFWHNLIFGTRKCKKSDHVIHMANDWYLARGGPLSTAGTACAAAAAET